MSSAQDDESFLKQEIRFMLKDKSNGNHNQEIRKFLRFLNSDNRSGAEIRKIHLVLNDFNQRELGFNSYYLYLIQVLSGMFESDVVSSVINNFLDFLLVQDDSFSRVEIKTYLRKINLLIESNLLSKTDYFKWKVTGDFYFDFNDDKKPLLYFPETNLQLFNNQDTIFLSNVSGYYDVFSNTFQGQGGQTSFENNNFLIDVLLDQFSLDLSKNFFQIDNANFKSSGVFYADCFGVYKDKLSASKSYPSFNSYESNYRFELFESVNVFGGLDLKGEIAYFKNPNGCVELSFQDDDMDYLVLTEKIQLTADKFFVSSAEFSIKNNLGAIYHPSVKLVYDDNLKKITIDRLSGSRGLSPIRNTFHGLNLFADRMEIDLVYDECLFFHYATGTDINVLIESNNYFDKTRYNDLLRLNFNPTGLLLEFLNDKNINQEYSLNEFATFLGLDKKHALDIVLDLEIFGLLKYDSCRSMFKGYLWAYEFFDSERNQYDYDSFKLQSIAGIGDTIAKIDFVLNEMEVFRVEKINISNRFNFDVLPNNKTIKFIDEKTFLFNGDILIGNFAFSGEKITFNYDDFLFNFGPNSILSFLSKNQSKLSKSIVHFDNGLLFVDSVSNKSGFDKMNDFPRFQVDSTAYLSYLNQAVNFSLEPFELNYLQDRVLKNIYFPGYLYLDGIVSNLQSVLSFDSTGELSTAINQIDSIYLYKNKILFSGDIKLGSDGLFGSGSFKSNHLLFNANNLNLQSGKLIGFVDSVKNGQDLISTPFMSSNAFVNYFPYESKFLLKRTTNMFNLYADFLFDGDLYFDGAHLNGSGDLVSNFSLITSSHHYFSNEGVMSADAICYMYKPESNTPFLFSKSVTVEHGLFSDTIFITKSTSPFELESIHHTLDFDFLIYDLNLQELYFENNKLGVEGVLINNKYDKGFLYNSLNAVYSINQNELCVYSVFPLLTKKLWLQPNDNSFCTVENGNFPVFKNATLIKNRRLFRDKLYNNNDVIIQPNLKLEIIND